MSGRRSSSVRCHYTTFLSVENPLFSCVFLGGAGDEFLVALVPLNPDLLPRGPQCICSHSSKKVKAISLFFFCSVILGILPCGRVQKMNDVAVSDER